MISDEAKLDVEHSYLYYKSKVSKKFADNLIFNLIFFHKSGKKRMLS